jgi:hypothetical protein
VGLFRVGGPKEEVVVVVVVVVVVKEGDDHPPFPTVVEGLVADGRGNCSSHDNVCWGGT